MPPKIAPVNITLRCAPHSVVVARPDTFEELKELAYSIFRIPRDLLLNLTGTFASTGYVQLDSSTYDLVHESATISIFFILNDALALAYPEMITRHMAICKKLKPILDRERARPEWSFQDFVIWKNALYNEAAFKDKAAHDQKLMTATEIADLQKQIADAEEATARAMAVSFKQEPVSVKQEPVSVEKEPVSVEQKPVSVNQELADA